MNINLHIERLILEGIEIPSRQHPALQNAVETELARLLVEGGLGSSLAAGEALREVPGGTVQVTGGNDPTMFGQQIARAVYGGIGG
jgi:hypothetical protein